MRFVKTVNGRGTVTLPAEVRSVLDIGEGDIVELEVLRVLRPRSVRENGPNVEMTERTRPADSERPPEVSP